MVEVFPDRYLVIREFEDDAMSVKLEAVTGAAFSTGFIAAFSCAMANSAYCVLKNYSFI